MYVCMYVIGDPRKLSEYMVKTGGRLMPDLLSREEMRELPVRIAALPCMHTYVHSLIHTIHTFIHTYASYIH